jgi:asparagine synthase (glutamine-hydrolysing)
LCSISGYFNPAIFLKDFEKLNRKLSHRGPDNSTIKEYLFKYQKFFLGHNRLSIQDLSQVANQPMENSQFAIVFNGEIYNHFEIRKKLSFNQWRTHSDTETLLWAFEEFGIEKTISELNGMFAIALFDKKNEKLYLIRDRVGIKPLYYTYQNGEFAFASELKGIPSHLLSSKSNEALIEFVSLGYIPAENTYYTNVFKLQAAHYLIFDGSDIKIKKYWNLPEIEKNISFDEAVENTYGLLQSSVKYRLLSDVEVGCFLSGGVDSSLVAAIMSQISTKKIKTFSIAFVDKKYDESAYARNIASILDTDHYEYICRPDDVINLIEDFDYYFDEPFGDASALPTMLVAKLASKHVKVALSGDGGDELFLGYDRYFFVKNAFDILRYCPLFLRKIIACIFNKSGNDKAEKLSYSIQNCNPLNLYSILATSVKPWYLSKLFTEEFLRNTIYTPPIDFLSLQKIRDKVDYTDLISFFSRIDFHRYLPDDILTKVDRATMKYSLEARVPILDHRIAEFAFSIPLEIKLMNGKKSILRKILSNYLPDNLVERPKKGFGVPLKDWFRSELKDLLYDKLASLDDSKFNKQYLYSLADEHIKNNKNYEYIFWNLLRL